MHVEYEHLPANNRWSPSEDRYTTGNITLSLETSPNSAEVGIWIDNVSPDKQAYEAARVGGLLKAAGLEHEVQDNHGTSGLGIRVKAVGQAGLLKVTNALSRNAKLEHGKTHHAVLDGQLAQQITQLELDRLHTANLNPVNLHLARHNVMEMDSIRQQNYGFANAANCISTDVTVPGLALSSVQEDFFSARLGVDNKPAPFYVTRMDIQGRDNKALAEQYHQALSEAGIEAKLGKATQDVPLLDPQGNQLYDSNKLPLKEPKVTGYYVMAESPADVAMQALKEKGAMPALIADSIAKQAHALHPNQMEVNKAIDAEGPARIAEIAAQKKAGWAKAVETEGVKKTPHPNHRTLS